MPDQSGMSQIGKMFSLVMNPGLFWGQMITVYGCGGPLVSGTIPPHCSTSHCPHSWCNGLGVIAYVSRSTLIVMRGTLTGQRYVDDILRPHHVWDQLNWQVPSCHSVHDLELAVQDLWAHLPQDNNRCLINSMQDRMAACIAAGGGQTRY
ncbi:uncharacterized protein TNCV_1916901 [Trichonephila clavipes]|uniref:Uncharacterized protein n=1 Tax=Trichonephila clavipes TaxID=2585209 RepID=A0A8X6W0G9_TRICX|nr:uncharacterized protein TNCV_1916901 [Trichonephila clavipes]